MTAFSHIRRLCTVYLIPPHSPERLNLLSDPLRFPAFEPELPFPFLGLIRIEDSALFLAPLDGPILLHPPCAPHRLFPDVTLLPFRQKAGDVLLHKKGIAPLHTRLLFRSLFPFPPLPYLAKEPLNAFASPAHSFFILTFCGTPLPFSPHYPRHSPQAPFFTCAFLTAVHRGVHISFPLIFLLHVLPSEN